MPRVFAFDPPDRFVLGTVGEPGQRTFFLQARDATRLVSVVLEKEQARALAERLDEILDEVRRRGGTDVPAGPPPELEDMAPLDAPIVEDFRVRALLLSWHDVDRVVVVEAHARAADGVDDEDGDDGDDDPADGDDDVLRVRISPAAARAFAARSLRVVTAGRPPCPLCGLPLDREGHVCPRQNGHRR